MNNSLKLLFVVNGVFVFASSLLGPLYAVYVEGISKSVIVVSSSWSLYLISSTFFTFLLSLWGDRVKHKENFLILGYLVRSIVWLSYSFIGSFSSLLLLQVFLGVGESLGTPAYDAIFAEHLDKHKHIMDYSRWKVISNMVGATATFIGGLVVSYYGFAPLFISMSVLSLLSALGVLLRPKNTL